MYDKTGLKTPQDFGDGWGTNLGRKLTSQEVHENFKWAAMYAMIPAGIVFDYMAVVVPSGFMYVPLAPKRISRTTYEPLWLNLNQIDWFAPDATAAADAEAAGEYHLPGITDSYVRGGIHGEIESVDTSSDEITISAQDGTIVTNTHIRNGTPIRFFGDNLPGNLVEYTTYYLTNYSVASKWKIYTTQADAESDSGTNQVSLSDAGSGTQYATQLGISLEDQMQLITGETGLSQKEDGTGMGIYRTDFSGALGYSNTSGLTMNGRGNSNTTARNIVLNSGNSPNARASATTDGENRPRTAFGSKIIKVL